MKNNTTKSVILAPFNSTISELSIASRIDFYDKDMFMQKQKVLTFARRCREADRQYEFNNNGQLDNGVYHKQLVQNSFEKEGDNLEEIEGIEVDQRLTSSSDGYSQ
jgi:hypothetical protein